MSEDLLGRWRLAKDVYAVVSETPKDWSCRIGIYGKWGEGKTSLLRFVETQAQADGLISFWINPSQAESADGLWRVVLEAFIDALDRENLLMEEVRAWRVRLLAEKTEPVDKLAELNQYAKALIGFSRAAIKEWLRADGEQIRKLRQKLHSKKVLVFIDDLDRTDPKLVPTLLLGLRDLLDLPGFCFLAAFDDEIVSQTLTHVNTAWGDGKAFLDKVLDFSFSLPKSTADQRLELVKYHIRQLCPWMNLDVVEQNSDLLPDTPRKLKALLRNLMTLGPLMKRHDPAEIQWVDFFLGQLVRLESPGFMEDFLNNGNDSLVQVGAYLPPNQDQPSFDKRIELAVKECGKRDDALRLRLTNILSVWSERRVFISTTNFGYYAGFGSTHRHITQREFDDLIQAYRELRDLNVLEARLVEHAALVASPQMDVAHEFLRILVETRGACLEDTADAEMESDAVDFLTRAHECLELVGSVLESPASRFDLTTVFSRTLVQSLVTQALRWIHFDRSVYQPTRQEERALLLSLAKKNIVAGLDWLEFLTPWVDPTMHFSREGQIAASQLIDELMCTVRERVTTEALELFAKVGTHLQFYGPKATTVSRFCFFDPQSPLWQELGRRQFFGVLENSTGSRAVRQNASELLHCLSWSRPPHGFAGNPEEDKKILLLPGVARALWAASTAERVHYRFQQRLIETREAILKIGVGEDQLPIPEWLAERVRELRESASDPSSSTTDAGT